MSDNLNEMPVRSTADEFDKAEMVGCTKCSRLSPPNRLECIYCGEDLLADTTAEARLAPVLRQPENEDEGVSLVVWQMNEGLNPEVVKVAKTMTRLEDKEVSMLLEAGCPVPLAFTDPGKEVEVALGRINGLGVSAEIVDDSVFDLGMSPIRLRGISDEGDGNLALIHFNNDEVDFISSGDIVGVGCRVYN